VWLSVNPNVALPCVSNVIVGRKMTLLGLPGSIRRRPGGTAPVFTSTTLIEELLSEAGSTGCEK
jgi:hypothetical protein